MQGYDKVRSSATHSTACIYSWFVTLISGSLNPIENDFWPISWTSFQSLHLVYMESFFSSVLWLWFWSDSEGNSFRFVKGLKQHSIGRDSSLMKSWQWKIYGQTTIYFEDSLRLLQLASIPTVLRCWWDQACIFFPSVYLCPSSCDRTSSSGGINQSQYGIFSDPTLTHTHKPCIKRSWARSISVVTPTFCWVLTNRLGASWLIGWSKSTTISQSPWEQLIRQRRSSPGARYHPTYRTSPEPPAGPAGRSDCDKTPARRIGSSRSNWRSDLISAAGLTRNY
jgi:hypothetical protein